VIVASTTRAEAALGGTLVNGRITLSGTGNRVLARPKFARAVVEADELMRCSSS